MRSRRLPGLPVLTLEDGVQLGKVRKALVDSREKRVAALVVAQRGWNQQRLLPMARLHALGSHAVTVERSDLLIPIKEAAEYEHLLKEDRSRVVGAPIVTAGGEFVGIVRDYEISGTGTVDALYVGKSSFPSMFRREPSIPGEFVISLGKDAVLVADEALAHVEESAKRADDQPASAGRKPLQLFSWPKGGKPDSPESE